MARPSKREQRRARLQCKECGRQFMGLAWYLSIETVDRGALEWILDNDPTRENRCPQCGSPALRVLHE